MMLTIAIAVLAFFAFLVLCVIAFYAKFYVKVDQGQTLIINKQNKTQVTFTGAVVIPIFARKEFMDISVRRVEIERAGKDGLICKDNVRADIRVAFYVRVNKTVEDVMRVAQSVGCVRASDPKALLELFDAKFSEALKTIGKNFDFVELYTSRGRFKEEILQVIGTDLNGYVLEDAAIDYLEQTPLRILNPENILDAEGIKKIVELTALQAILSNNIAREKEKTITKQDIEAKEAILELNRQLTESEEKQKREILTIKAREQAEAVRVQQEEKLRYERARITTEEEIRVAEEQKERQVIVAVKNKERTEKIETERVEKERMLEATERERTVELAQIDKEKALEVQRKAIQDVIRERVAVQKAVVAEEEKIKDTQADAEADRSRRVRVVAAEAQARELLVKEVQAAESSRQAAELDARRRIVEADAEMTAALKKAEAMTTIASARADEEAVLGMSEVNVMRARASAIEEQGTAEAAVLEKKALAEARGLEARAQAIEKQGSAEAEVMAKKFRAEATGIEQKADAMKKLDGVGKEHEEFKLRLNKQKEVELAEIGIQKDIAEAQAKVISEAVKSAKIDIVGGETMFFDRIIGAITQGKQVDRLVDNSRVLGDIRETFFSGDGEHFAGEIKKLVGYFGLKSEDVKNITVAALLTDLMGLTDNRQMKDRLGKMLGLAVDRGLGEKPVADLVK